MHGAVVPDDNLLLLEHLVKDLPEALLEEVSLFPEICPWWFARLDSSFHYRFACKQMHCGQPSLLMKTFWCWGPFLKLFNELVKVCKSSSKPFTVHILGSNSFSSLAVFFSLASSAYTFLFGFQQFLISQVLRNHF